MGDHSRHNIQKLDPRFIGTHARLSPSIRWLDIANQIALNKENKPFPSERRDNHSTMDPKHSQNSQSFFMSLVKTICLAAWLMIPNRLRLSVYKMLRMVGYRLYGKHNAYEPVQRLPFGIYLKYPGDPDGFRNEFNALQMVRRYTSLPVPQPLDFITIPAKSTDPFYSHDAYLLTSRVPGILFQSAMT